MAHLAFPSVLLLLIGAPLPEKPGKIDLRAQYSQFTIRQRITVRVPRLPDPPRNRQQATVKMVEWKEKKAEKCQPINLIAGASVTRVDSVDLIMVDNRRLRARFDDDCRAIDFYAGFYLKRTPDGMICARRDAIRSRSGDSCRIEAFKTLQPKR
ncbi:MULTISPECIES: hypothetical protein [unclassified Sphingomonas]|uniref:hypothetical protein n=1 Tax=unclassified Sphingomonas TaxID=196159 RepID=UPI000BC5FD61|nr:MAG: hypothetical protein B7Z43_09565 [Sphingomonas sp. 12-62-6]OYX38023.1 MAG: hypothetical protein B7Y98_10635 [Sphingomonas sp. 32-62-10]